MKKYLSLFKTSFAGTIEYRANLFSTLLLEAISIASVVILWVAIYRAQSGDVAGYSFSEAITYYLLVPVAGFLTQVTLSDRLSLEIRNGFFSNYLLRPFKFWLASFAGVLATKVNYVLLVSPVIIGVLVYVSLGGTIMLRPAALLAALCIAGLAFVFHFVLDLAIAFAAFWLDDVWAFRHIKTILFSVLGGLSFPLEFVSEPFRLLLGWLPFQYLYYVPIMYSIGRRPVSMLLFDSLQLLAWTGLAAGAAAILWRRGLRKYGAYGR